MEYPLIYAGVPRRERRPRTAEVLEAVGLAHKAEARSNSLSGGEQQRVAVARALVNSPRVLLADEPTGQLDAANTGRLMAYLRNQAEERRMGVIVVTHDPAVAAYCDTTYRLENGRVASEPGRLYVANPQTRPLLAL